MNEPQGRRESVWSVAQPYVTWCLALIFLLTIGWTAFVGWVEITTGEQLPWNQLTVVVVSQSGPGTPLIFILSIMLVTLADTLGGGTLITKRYLENKFVRPLIEQHEERGRAQGEKQGAEKRQKLWEAWNRRRLEAEAKGEPFNEPPPGSAFPNGRDASEE